VPADVEGYCESKASASGRRAMSAMTTLQPFERRSFAKQKLIPEPAPVIIAVFPSTFMAIAAGEWGGRARRKEKGEGKWECSMLNAIEMLSRAQAEKKRPSAAYLYTYSPPDLLSVSSRRVCDVV
jgi:hypothetical protein